MLSDRERSQFALIEQGLVIGDPLFVSRCAALGRRMRRSAPVRSGRTMHAAGVVPTMLLACGLLLLVLGGASAAVPVVVAGILLAMAALGLALTTPQRRARPA